MKVKVKGFRELERQLAEELPKATARNVLLRTAENSMERMRTRMAQLAPFDPQDRDGDGKHLNETMKTERVSTAKRERGSVKFQRSSGVEVMTGPAPVGTRARSNAGFQENGTVKMPPHAYVRPAFDTEATGVVEDVKRELTLQIDKAKARIARKAAKVKA